MTRINPLKSIAIKYAAIALLPMIALFYPQIRIGAIMALGDSVLLETLPVDPTDFLRGDYVTLDYRISDIPETLLTEKMRDRESWNWNTANVYVALDRDDSGRGSIRSVSEERPSDGLYIRGRLYYRWSSYVADYGLGVYYVPEGTGREIERKINDSKVLADVRIFRGYPVIKGLVFVESTDDERRDTEQNWGNSPAVPVD